MIGKWNVGTGPQYPKVQSYTVLEKKEGKKAPQGSQEYLTVPSHGNQSHTPLLTLYYPSLHSTSAWAIPLSQADFSTNTLFKAQLK